MEKFRCKLCLRKFANGRALGGHMRSHMMNLHVPPKKEEQKQEQLQHQHQIINDDDDDDDQQQPSEEFVQAVPPPSSSSADEENENNGDHDVEKDLPCYGLRENPKRRVRTVDPEFFSAVEAGSVVLQDRESETESSKNHNCRRSKRIRKSRISDTHQCSAAVVDHYIKGKIPGRINESSSCVEAEPVSSISDTTPEEDVAYCLMMLSRDKWVIEEEEEEEDDDYYDEEEEKKCINDDLNEVDFAVVKVTKARSSRGKYRCETCNKVFRSYQALGGHRASHKKIKLNNGTVSTQEASEMVMKTGNGGSDNVVVVVEEKIHECPVCFRVFSSGQALGGHKRSHGTIAAPATVSVAKPVSRMIDLNLPAPLDDDNGEISQMEVSAVSD